MCLTELLVEQPLRVTSSLRQIYMRVISACSANIATRFRSSGFPHAMFLHI